MRGENSRSIGERADTELVGLARVDQFQAVALQDTLNLVFGVDGPGSGGVELYVGAPVLQRLARRANFFVSKSDVIVRVRIGGRELNGGFVRTDRFFNASGFVEDIAEVKIGERVARVDLNGRTVMPLGRAVFLPVVIERAQVDVRGRVCP